ncbi:MAG: hypothetical protein EZS28_030397 [Streblomastix strix]|uniref:Uncharacterized protein n=1 Tax=Streblomastix strix TaxID=222440 RepID=A0A5J4UTY1_9EUKA|nr:MAG: hypothetical protein EZS28_030397 [Streblomastix strix]
MHRVNIAGKDFIKKFWYNKQAFRESATSPYADIPKRINPYDFFDKKCPLADQSGGMLRTPGSVTVLTLDHRITHIIGIDFNSLYPSVMSSEPHKFIKYTGGKMYMPGSVCLDMNKLHFVEGDTDSAYWAVSGDVNDDYKQQFNFVIKDKQFYDENAKFFFPTIEGDLFVEKKILGLAIEREGTEMIALAPKNYYIKVGDKEKIKLKGVNQTTNKITKDQIMDNITNGTITTCTNMRLASDYTVQ